MQAVSAMRVAEWMGTLPATTRLTFNEFQAGVAALVRAGGPGVAPKPPSKPKRRRAVTSPDSPFKNPERAAAYLGKSLSWFKKNARRIKCQPGTGLYHVDDLTAFAAATTHPRRRPPMK